jgi:hypothetical protein
MVRDRGANDHRPCVGKSPWSFRLPVERRLLAHIGKPRVCGAFRQLTCKPDSVVGSHPSAPPSGGAGLAALRPTWNSASNVDVPAWPCTGWGLPGRRVTTPPVRSYRTISTLPATRARASPPLRRCVSVALSRGFRRVGFPDHPALRCPDFPRAPVFSPASRGCLVSNTKGRSVGVQGLLERRTVSLRCSAAGSS